MTGPDLEGSAAEKMIMNPARRRVATSGDAMARVREKYGRGVAGLPLGLRVGLTVALCLPSAFWFATSLVTGPPWTALTLAIAVLFAAPLYLLLPTLWQRTEESIRDEWHERRVQKHLEVEMGVRELEPRVHLDPTRPIPRRW
ncbi:MAG: hypothetical protein U0R76_00120 [Candidatus Nanopelagicales bacterium]